MTELNGIDQDSIRKVILEQLEALTSLDGERALQRLTRARRRGTGPHFLKSIANAYPQLAQVWRAEFGEVREVDGRIAQHVRVTAWDHSTLDAVYLVERQGDGTWLIDGCVCRPDEQPARYIN